MTVFNPCSIQASLTPAGVQGSDLTLEDVLHWLDSPTAPLGRTTRRLYKRSVQRAAKLLRNRPEDIVANRKELLREFPLEDYRCSQWKSVNAMKSFRRNLSAAINGATGAIAARKSRNHRNDSWNHLLEGLLAAAEDPTQSLPFNKNKCIAISVLADFARQLDLEVHQLEGIGRDALLALPMETKQRLAVIEGFELLRKLQKKPLPTVSRFLPKTPVPAVNRTETSFELPKGLQEELEFWIKLATRGDWSETDEDYVNGRLSKPVLDASRKVLKTLSVCEVADIGEMPTIAFAFDQANIVACVKKWRTWWDLGDRQAITPKTAGTYLFSLVRLLEKNGEQADHLRKIIRTDNWISAESGSESKMTKKNKNFCRTVVTQRGERLKFQSHHIRLRSLSQWHLDMARNGPTMDAEKHRIKARQIGTCAAFAAIETDVSPLRASVALILSYKGQDPWLDLGHEKKSGGHLLIPAAANKNKKEISVPIPASSKLRGLETLRWFEREIRPLFNASAENNFFLPAVNDDKCQLAYGT
ncbi:hypothetical protein, partial [Aquicoccus sp. SU-CL01552]|uniref:hypothetical protein n=1 Tax=Aquicoccus sp. SU-CL01552 TaxID=3127656 RepID=UPI0033422D45